MEKIQDLNNNYQKNLLLIVGLQWNLIIIEDTDRNLLKIKVYYYLFNDQ